MYLRILKKDLKRKKTMNCILLLFVILSSMFAASSVNNIVTVVNGLDYYFDKAGMSDYYLVTSEPDGDNTISEILDDEGSVTDYRKEEVIMCTADNFLKDGKKLADFSAAAIVMSIDGAKLNYFDSDNHIISNVKPGTVYISTSMTKNAGLKTGDTLEFKIGETALTLEFAGTAKDAFLGSDMIGNPKFILNDGDYAKMHADSVVQSDYMGGLYYVNTNDVTALEAATADCSTLKLNIPVSTVKMSYVMNMLIAGILLIVSICLILVSFVVLRFTIGFTIAEEFREIGVMKAVGIKNASIRNLYLIKYFGISVVGAFIGYIASVPFGNMMLASVSENMVLGNENTFIIGILCSIAVVVMILLFCRSCTGKIKKLSPVDAVRSGQTGERFHKKSLMHLGKSRLKTTGFLSLNDVLSSPRQYGIITAVFSICILLVMILANSANTLNSEKLLFLFGSTKSDVYYSDSSRIMDTMRGITTLEKSLSDIEKTLEENDMPGKVHLEVLYQLPITYGNAKLNIKFQHCKDTKANAYTYSEGTAPRYENEIALSKPAAEKLGASIGNTVSLTISGEDNDYIITALYSGFNNLGDSGRLHESVSIPDMDIAGCLSFQIDFDDKPDSREVKQRIEKLKALFGSDKIYDTQEFVKTSTGAADIVSGVKNLVLIISIIIIIMISVLMERSFIAKEKSEIALMKAIGFKSSSIIAQHTVRFAIVSIMASVIAIALSTPLTKLCIDPIFGMMGAVNGIDYEIRPFEIFTMYPLMILTATLAGTFLTALYTKTVKASDTSDIE